MNRKKYKDKEYNVREIKNLRELLDSSAVLYQDRTSFMERYELSHPKRLCLKSMTATEAGEIVSSKNFPHTPGDGTPWQMMSAVTKLTGVCPR